MQNFDDPTLDELSKVIYEEPFKPDVAYGLLEEMNDGIIKFKDEIAKLKEDVRDGESEIAGLLESLSNEMSYEIDMGIGNLKYETDGNIVIEELMDSLAELVEKVGALKATELITAKNILCH